MRYVGMVYLTDKTSYLVHYLHPGHLVLAYKVGHLSSQGHLAPTSHTDTYEKKRGEGPKMQTPPMPWSSDSFLTWPAISFKIYVQMTHEIQILKTNC